jgi:hypothetical protein
MALILGAILGVTGCSSSGGQAPGGSSHPAPVGTPTGTVTIRSGGKVVCVITLNQNGTGTCTVGSGGYTPGKVTFTGTYPGSARFKAGTGSTTITLLPAKPAGPVASSAGPVTT